MIRIYVDAGFRDGGVAGLGLVCTSFSPWIAEARYVTSVSTCTAAELAAVEWAIRWADGLPVEVLTDCQPAITMLGSRCPPVRVPPAARVAWVRRETHPANVEADRLATLAMNVGADVAPHRLDPPPGFLAEPREMIVAWPNGRRQLVRVVADDGQRATVHVGYARGRKFRSRTTTVPSLWLKHAR